MMKVVLDVGRYPYRLQKLPKRPYETLITPFYFAITVPFTSN